MNGLGEKIRNSAGIRAAILCAVVVVVAIALLPEEWRSIMAAQFTRHVAPVIALGIVVGGATAWLTWNLRKGLWAGGVVTAILAALTVVGLFLPDYEEKDRAAASPTEDRAAASPTTNDCAGAESFALMHLCNDAVAKLRAMQ